jgi:response regulator receiver domain
MRQSVLIIDDEINQAENLSKALKKRVENTDFHYVSAEEEITTAIENRYFSVAIVDLRMDKFSFDGIDCIQKIFEINPFAKVIVISAFAGEYFLQIKDLLLTGKVIDVVEKESFDAFTEKLASLIINYHQKVFDNPSEINNALIENYAQAKNEPDNYKKGERFEHFVSLLFQSIGFNNISKRVKDQSANEVDLIIRNEIDDIFINKFGKYILVECKNKPKEQIGKNDVILFKEKLAHTNGLSELGIFATTGNFTKTARTEIIRSSGENRKILFLSNIEFERIILSDDKLSAFKSIIDEQVKDN